jgi:GxxExxY protein
MAEGQKDQLTEQVIGLAIEVHRRLGPGLLESVYEKCLCYELDTAKVPHRRQAELPVTYKEIRLDCAYRMDIVIANELIIELKTVDRLLPVHEAQLLTYLRISGIRTGLLLNFNTALLKDGLRRLVL